MFNGWDVFDRSAMSGMNAMPVNAMLVCSAVVLSTM